MGFLSLARLCLLAGPLAASMLVTQAAQGQVAIRFTLDGRVEQPEPLFLVPQDKGYFKAEGLDVSFDEVSTPVEPIARIAAGNDDAGFVDLNALIRYRDQHPSAPVKAVFMVYNKPPYAIVTRKSRGITEPKQIEGKRLGAPTIGSSFAQWPLFAKLNDIDVSKVTVENIGIPVRAPMLAAGQIDAAVGASFRLYVDLKDRGVPVDDIVSMPMADYGLKLYGGAIVVSSRFAAEKPEVVQALLRAFLKGLREIIRHPQQAVESVLRRDDGAKPDVELERLRMAIRDNILTREVKAGGLGGIDEDRLAEAIDQLALVQPFKAKPKPEDAFDPAFLPGTGERRVN